MSKFILSGFSDEIDSDFNVQLEQISKLNIAYIEIRGVNGRNITEHTLEEVKEIKNQLDAAGIKVSAIGSPIGKIHIEDEFEPHFELFKHTVEIASLLETNYIRLFSFFMDANKACDYRDEVLARLMAFRNCVKGTNIILLHENEKGIYGDTAERCLDLYNSIGSDNFKLIFDPANFVQCEEETYPHAFNLLKDDVVYYHIKDAKKDSGKVVPSGFGDGHLKEIIKELHERNYEGFLSIEPHLGHFDGFDDLEDSNHVILFEEKSDVGKFKLAAESIRSIIKEVTNG
jgi:sugar phosphate isomerase/epimerase